MRKSQLLINRSVTNFCLIVIIYTTFTSAYRPYPDPGYDIDNQRYCTRRRSDQCCPGRDDACTAPILDTVCYCDIFCNRTVSDCCPDFWRSCLGIAPPPGAWTLPGATNPGVKNNCFYEGQLYGEGATIHPNCNNCTCVDVVEKMEYNWKCTQKICLVREEILDMVNEGDYGWKAQNYSKFWGKTLSHGITYRLGTFRPMKYVKQMMPMNMQMNGDLPHAFDARERWPGSIHAVLDQGDCGASWAFSTASVAADRLSIHSHGMFNDMLSPQNLLDCDKDHMQNGCEGGYIDRAWWYMRRSGVVSNDCYPYISGMAGQTQKCRSSMNVYYPGATVDCSSRGGKSRVYQASPTYRIAGDENEIMKEIMQNGPVQATMEVKEDLFTYKHGVYRYSMPQDFQPPNHSKTGFHSVKLIGWGVEESTNIPTKYWIAMNSWGPWWGEQGTFRILRGVDESSIESFVIGVWGKVNGRQIMQDKEMKLHRDMPQNDDSKTPAQIPSEQL